MTELRQKQPRIRNEGYLKWLRLKGCCCGCISRAPSDAAHLRAGSLAHDKPVTGMGIKPSDCWALPLRHDHHMAQHRHGSEVEWWNLHGIDPFALAKRYYAQYLAESPSKPVGAIRRKPAREAKPRAKTNRRPPNQRQKAKIPSRPFPPGRKFGK